MGDVKTERLSRLDFGRSLESSPAMCSGEEHGLLSRTAVGNRTLEAGEGGKWEEALP